MNTLLNAMQVNTNIVQVYVPFQNRRATEFLDQQSTDRGPFFMMLSTPAAHAPFTPAPKYHDMFVDKQAPRTPNFNIHGKVNK